MTKDATQARLLHALTSASNHATAQLVLDRLDLDSPLAPDVLLGLLLQTVGQRTTEADDAVVVSFGGHTLTSPVHDGDVSPEPGDPEWEAMTEAMGDGEGPLVAELTGATGVRERLAWELTQGWAWPAEVDDAVAGPQLWLVALQEQRDEQRCANRALEVGTSVLRQVLALLPPGPATLRVIDAGPDRQFALLRDDGGVHVTAGSDVLEAEAVLIGTPVAEGVGAVTLLLHTGDEAAEGAALQGWRVEPTGVLALDVTELKHEFAPHWFDRHRGLSYLDASPIAIP